MTLEERVEWDRQIDVWIAAVRAIIVQPDIDTALGNFILARLNNIYDEVRPVYGRVVKQYKTTEGLIARIKDKNFTGINDGARKKAAIESVENVELGNGDRVNLYELMDELICKKEDLDTVLNMIEKKSSVCITISQFLRVESNLAGR